MNEFEAPGQVPIEITIRGKTGKYLICEVSAVTIDEIFGAVNSAPSPASKARAAKDLPGKIISTCVLNQDGSSISFEEASKFRFTLQKALQKEIMEINGLGPDADEEAKKG